MKWKILYLNIKMIRSNKNFNFSLKLIYELFESIKQIRHSPVRLYLILVHWSGWKTIQSLYQSITSGTADWDDWHAVICTEGIYMWSYNFHFPLINIVSSNKFYWIFLSEIKFPLWGFPGLQIFEKHWIRISKFLF